MTPRAPLLIAGGLWTLLGLAAVWWPQLRELWRWLGVLGLGVLALDAWRLWRTPDPTLARELVRNQAQGRWSQVRLDVTNRAARRISLSLHDLHPLHSDTEGLPVQLRLNASASGERCYRLRPRRRGDFEISACDCALNSPLGLWRARRCLRVRSELRVFPDITGARHQALLAAQSAHPRPGRHPLPRLGRGTEFHEMRDYRAGDALHQIDWKATSRMQRLISRDYEDERDQHLLLLLDCGRHMRHAEGERAHLDEALEALLLLARLGLRQGDAVGFMTYGGPHRWFAPRKGEAALWPLLEAMHDLEPSLEASDALSVARDLMRITSRRALVVVVTNSRGEDQPGLEQALGLLRRRHLVVLADLRETRLDEAFKAPIRQFRDALRFHALHQWFESRRAQHARLSHLGIDVLDLPPARLPLALIERYNRIKRTAAL
ncbi:MAG: DUF58 domain-containing protein [Chromatiaceae bacterium]|nr:DUF58 domain-containing protein [Chromatiaceae bacterium]